MKKILSIFLLLIIFNSAQTYSQPVLSSFSSARATIYLDFNGEFVNASSWNGGTPFYCAPSGLSDDQITEIFNRVSEDYRPFNINITTDSSVFLKAPLTQRIRIIITPTSGWYQGVGGVSYTGSFIWGDDTPGFVFPDRLGYKPKNIAECCTHESGHTVGLSHQAKYNGSCTLLATYNDGFGTGEIGWAPVMGNSYYRNLSGWNNGPTPSGCTADQDNLSIITSRNGFSYRTDDHSNDVKKNPTSLNIVTTLFSEGGIITTNTDKDAFKINLPKGGNFKLTAKPYSVGPNNEGADLDIQLTLLNSSMKVMRVYNPQDKLDVAIDTLLAAGDYYMVLEGSGNENATNYGSLGSYNISGEFQALAVMPINDVFLSGENDNGVHNLTWRIVADEPLKSLTLESSVNGSIFNTLTPVASDVNSFHYSPLIKGNIFYRLKTISVTGQTVYSNIISLRSTEARNETFRITTLVTSTLIVNASQNFAYQLADMSGRIIRTGKANAGVAHINMNNSPNGIYIMQIISNHQRTTQRIVKL
jgi:hypothetical protein